MILKIDIIEKTWKIMGSFEKRKKSNYSREGWGYLPLNN